MRVATEDLREERERLFRLLLNYRGEPLTITQKDMAAGLWDWREVREFEPYSYRTVLPNEVVFDVDAGSWEECKRATEAVWDVLNEMQVPYWGALSGGQGTHTHVLVEPRDQDLRQGFSGAAYGLVEDRWRDVVEVGGAEFNIGGDPPPLDERLLTPGEDSRMVREFGARDDYVKRLYHLGPGEYRSIDLSREACYSYSSPRIPKSLPVARYPPGAWHAEVRRAVGGMCPRRSDCLGQDACGRCPARENHDR